MRRSRLALVGLLVCFVACAGEVTEGVGNGMASGSDSSTSDEAPTTSGTSTTAGMSGSAGTTIEPGTSTSDGMPGESTDDDTTGNGSTDDADGSTGETTMGDGSTSAGHACDAQPGDGPCTMCLKQSCCDDYEACMANMACACWDACLKGGGTLEACWLQCGAVPQALQDALGACFEGVCSNACS